MKTNEALIFSNFLTDIASKCTGKLGYAIARNIRLLNTELTEYNNKRNELIRKYGAEKGDQIVIEKGSKEYYSFLEEMKEYEDIDVDVELMKVSQEILESSELNANTMLILMDYMVE